MTTAFEKGLLGEVLARLSGTHSTLHDADIPGMLADAKDAVAKYDTLPDAHKQLYWETLSAERAAIIDEIKAKVPAAESAHEADESPDNAYHVGSLYRQMGDHANAQVWFREALEHDGNYADALNDLGYCVLHEGNLEADKIDEAQALLTRARELAPSLPTSNLEVAADHKMYADKAAAGVPIDYNGEGVLYTQLDRFAEAKTSFEKAIEQNSHNAEAYNNLSLCQQYLGDFGPALASAIKALELHPGVPLHNLHQAAVMVKHCIDFASRQQ